MSQIFLRGVEMPLPEGERVLWQGAPARAELLLHAFHARKVVIYFGVLILLSGAFAGDSATPMHTFLMGTMWLCIAATVASMFLFVFATLSARTTLYAITERRVVMKIGITLPVVLNVPLAIINSVNTRPRAHGRGDIALQLAGDSRVAYLVLWPHARAWHIRHPEPLLRGVDDAANVGAILHRALLAQMTALEQIAVEPGIADMPPIAASHPDTPSMEHELVERQLQGASSSSGVAA